MTTAAEWVEGARPRTLPAAFSPVLAGTGVAIVSDGFSPVLAVLALVVSVALQIGVNYANDYSDGIRGTDTDRVGPMRLVGSGAAPAKVVKRAAFVCFAVACLAGLVMVVLSQLWWLIAVGAAAVLAAWFYTGGPKPYGYLGLGELFVFVFFGLVAVGGTVLVQVGSIPLVAAPVAIAIGLLACAILVANNLRDLVGDKLSGKRTMATRIGDAGTRVVVVVLCGIAAAMVIITAALSTWWALLGLAFVVLAVPACVRVLRRATGLHLVAVLKLIGLSELVCSLGLLVGLAVG